MSELSYIITFRVRIKPAYKMDFTDWQAKLNAEIVRFSGFISLEFLSSNSRQEKWVIVQRFSTRESALAWRGSTQCLDLLAELKNYLAEKITETSDLEKNGEGNVTEIIVTQVHPEQEDAYREWSAKIHQIESKFPGFKGVYIQSPRNRGKNWITLLQFDTQENLDNWLGSSERLELLKNSGSAMASCETHRVMSPYAGWFASLSKTGDAPALWKQTMIILLVLFPIVMLEMKYLNPLIAGLNSSLATFIGNAISVTLISFPMMPIAIWFLGWWLAPAGKKAKQQTIIGTAIVLFLYLIEIIVFWNLL
jgi:antibiotic biosynthesis monooxygenase (ABM) superfamily enzyme